MQIVQKLWPHLNASEIQSDEYQRFLALITANVAAMENSGSPDQVSLNEWIYIIEQVRSRKSFQRREIVLEIQQNGHCHDKQLSDGAICRALNLAASLWLALDIWSPTQHLPSGRGIIWPDDQSLSSVIDAFFQSRKNKPVEKGVPTAHLNHELTMATLVGNYNYGVVWTNNLAEHLKVDWENKTITVFEHKVFLWNHIRLSGRALLPPAVLEEALDTMNLLFPFDHPPTESLLHRQKICFHRLGYCGRPRELDIDKFAIWRGRLGELNRILDEPPAGIHQLGLDKSRRNLLQFATFWMATAVAVLTIITFVIGVYSAVYARKQYDVGLLQYRLSLAQACAALDAKTTLPEFCS